MLEISLVIVLAQFPNQRNQLMSNILIFDTECNSLDTENGHIQELAWAVFDTDSWRCLRSRSSLISWPGFYEVDDGAFQVTGLSREFCNANGESPFNAFSMMAEASTLCEYICGHNMILYDYPMLNTNFKRAMLFELSDHVHIRDMKKIDTLTDCPFPKTQKIHALKYLALDHGYILSNAHEALADVFACKAILSKYNFEQVKEIAASPMITLRAKIDFNNKEAREQVKEARFYWNPTEKIWVKNVREIYLPDIKKALTLVNFV